MIMKVPKKKNKNNYKTSPEHLTLKSKYFYNDNK